MKLLVTGDWQTEYANIDQCKTCLDFVIKVAIEKSLEGIAINGDLKHAYNPIDQRILRFWMDAIDRIKENKLRVIINLGNHDREGLYTDSKNWLFALKKAGAETFDKPGICQLLDGKLAMLPFTRKKSLLRERAKFLAKNNWNKNRDILLFHDDVSECKYNVLGIKSNSKLSINELYPEKYLAAIGGHIHLQQEIGKNTYYVGSPFAMDWGEANQRKRFILVDGDNISSINSPLPGWYDESLPNFYKPKSYEGARVRVHCKVPIGTDSKKIIERAEKLAERKYRGAIIKIVPEFEENKNNKTVLSLDDSDEQKIRQYVSQTIPEKLITSKDKIILFLTNKLKQSEGLLRHGGRKIRFISAEGTNVLSFEKVRCILEKQGLVAIKGENKDWLNQSNGSGKTNYVQLLPVSLFGTTFKGQKFDKWARRNTSERAEIELKLKDYLGNKISIDRRRRPNWLQLFVNGHDNSSGLNKSHEEGTQARIESITGFTWQTLSNSVYIDRTIGNSFLAGKKSERTNLLYKFQNLERFEKALVLIKKFCSRQDTAVEQTERAIDHIKVEVKELKNRIEETEVSSEEEIKEKRKAYHDGLSTWKELHSKAKKLERKSNEIYRTCRKEYKEVANLASCKEKTIDAIKPLVWNTEQSIQKYENLLSTGKCPTCKTKVNKDKFIDKIKRYKNELKKVEATLQKEKDKYQKLNETCALIEGEIDKANLEASEAKSKAVHAKQHLRSIKKILDSDYKRINQLKAKLVNKHKKRKKELNDYIDYLESLKKEKRFTDYCIEAFSKEGIPAFINSQVCPILNKAALYYSDLFCDKEIVVRFELEDGHIIPEIVNTHGGEYSVDQSNGEAAIAGLITSFALKEIAPKTNVLILDEPEAGLSPENITRFARKLLEIRKQWETIFVVTHSSILLSELSNEKLVKIVKRKGISKVIQ